MWECNYCNSILELDEIKECPIRGKFCSVCGTSAEFLELNPLSKENEKKGTVLFQFSATK